MPVMKPWSGILLAPLARGDESAVAAFGLLWRFDLASERTEHANAPVAFRLREGKKTHGKGMGRAVAGVSDVFQ